MAAAADDDIWKAWVACSRLAHWAARSLALYLISLVACCRSSFVSPNSLTAFGQ